MFNGHHDMANNVHFADESLYDQRYPLHSAPCTSTYDDVILFCNLTDSALAVSIAMQQFIRNELPRDDLSEALQHIMPSAKRWYGHRREPERLYILLDDAVNGTIDADPGCTALFGSKMTAIATVAAVRYYIETMTTNQYLIDSDLLDLSDDLNALSFAMSSNDSANRSLSEIIKCRQKLMVNVEHKYSDKNMSWHHPLRSTMEFVADLIISKPTFFQTLFALNLTVIDVLGHGLRATVYKAESRSFPNTFYAVKHFDDVALCRHEERILMMFKTDQFIGAPIAHLLGHQMMDCEHHSGFLMQYVRGQNVHTLRAEVARQHHPSGDPLHFIRDLGDQMVSALTDHVHPVGVYHGDINAANIMYDAAKKRFYLIDFGLAHNVEENRNPYFGGSWQHFGPSA